MRNYHVTLTRENEDRAINDVHYYVILAVDNEKAAAENAMRRAVSDYPGDDIGFQSCRETRTREPKENYTLN